MEKDNVVSIETGKLGSKLKGSASMHNGKKIMEMTAEERSDAITEKFMAACQGMIEQIVSKPPMHATKAEMDFVITYTLFIGEVLDEEDKANGRK